MSYRPYRRTGINPIWVLIGVNCAILIAEFINPLQIFDKFALSRSVVSTEPWTLITYMFVHGGLNFNAGVYSLDIGLSFWHLFANMLTLYFFGTFVIALVGETAFLVTYFIGGIVAGLFFILLSPNGGVVGASGAVYALGGLLMVMRPNVRVYTFPLPIPMPLWIAILIGFVLVSFNSGVAWQAHLGGIIYGAAVGYYYRRRERRGRY